MQRLTRRSILAGASANLACLAGGNGGTAAVDETLRAGIASRQIPCVVGMAASPDKILYAGAFGQRDSSGVPVRVDGLFQIASMTKAITTVAAMQLVEQGTVSLTEPVAKHLPQLDGLDVLEGFDGSGKPILKKSRAQITLSHLLTHTSGLCYDIWDGGMFRYTSRTPGGANGKPGPLMFEPGQRWQYGQGIDWSGRLVEKISGMTLEDYFQQKILRPLGMVDTSYILPESKFERMVGRYHREEGRGDLLPDARKQPAPPKAYNGGGGLYSTAADYVRFMQMILNHGAGHQGERILQSKTVDTMMTNHIGGLSAGKMKSSRPGTSSDVDMQPGHTEKWGYGFLINTSPFAGGRAAGSLAWAGINNTYYWIDPKNRRCAVILMQYLPFVDKEAIGLLNDFERSVYRNLHGRS
jgi:methyl acetate hydrolase